MVKLDEAICHFCGERLTPVLAGWYCEACRATVNSISTDRADPLHGMIWKPRTR